MASTYCMYISYLYLILFYLLKISIFLISHIVITIGTIAYLFAVITKHLMYIITVLSQYQLLVGITSIVSITTLKLQVLNFKWVLKFFLHSHLWKIFIYENGHIVMKSMISKPLTYLYISDFSKLVFSTRRG